LVKTCARSVLTKLGVGSTAELGRLAERLAQLSDH
jgi:hypothetical protein